MPLPTDQIQVKRQAVSNRTHGVVFPEFPHIFQSLKARLPDQRAAIEKTEVELIEWSKAVQLVINRALFDIIAAVSTGNQSSAGSVTPPVTVSNNTAVIDSNTDVEALLKIVIVSSHATGGDGTVTNPWTGWDNLVWKSGVHYVFPSGYYEYSNPITITVGGFRWSGGGSMNTFVTFVGTGVALTLIGSPPNYAYQIHLENMTWQGGVKATKILTISGYARSSFTRLRLRDATETVLELHGIVVSNRFTDIAISGNEGALNPNPTDSGLKLNGGGISNNTFTNLAIESLITAVGIKINGSINNIFYGGTSEGNVIGIQTDAASNNNIFHGMDVEANSDIDVNEGGVGNQYTNFFGGSTLAVLSGAKGLTLVGGKYQDIIFRDGAVSATLVGVGVSHYIVDQTGTVSARANIKKFGVYTINTDTYETDQSRDFQISNNQLGSSIQFGSVNENVIIGTAPFTDTSMVMPTNAVILAVAAYTKVTIPGGASTYTVGSASAGPFFNTAPVSAIAGGSDPGTANVPFKNGSQQNVRITPDIIPSTNAGRVRIVISYYISNPPGS